MRNKEKTKIGIFGGSFDPVHKGHVAIAEAFINELSLDMLYIIPNRVSPMKNMGNVSSEDRYNMLEIAFSEIEKATVSDMELKRDGVSYTRDTVKELRSLHPESELYFLTGDDWIGSIHKWKDADYILKNVILVVARRSGKDITEAVENIYSLSGKRPMVLDNEIVNTSSTEFRLSLSKDALPQKVYEYIRERGLYGI